MTAITVFDRHQAMMVKNLRPVLTERGKIKIGQKGRMIASKGGVEFQPPQKLDHFVITTLERGGDNNFIRDDAIHALLGDKPTVIPVRLLFNEIDLNFQTRYVAFQGRTIWCQGDGETATRDGEPRQCPCRNLERDYNEKAERAGPVCKINGRLQVMIDSANGVGGVWVFRTTSWNTVQGLISSMALIASVTGGRLAGVPLDLTVRPKQATDPQGRQQTVYVVGIEYRGSIDELRDKAYHAALSEAQQGERLRTVQEAAARMIAAPVVAPDEETDVRDEFYPEEAAAEAQAPTITAADRRAAMQAAEGSALVELIDADGEVHYVLPGEVEQWKRDNAGAEVVEAEPEPSPEPKRNGTSRPITVWLGRGQEASGPAAEVLPQLAARLDDPKATGAMIEALVENNPDLLAVLKGSNKERMDARIAAARERTVAAAVASGDHFGDLEDPGEWAEPPDGQAALPMDGGR